MKLNKLIGKVILEGTLMCSNIDFIDAGEFIEKWFIYG